MRRLGKTLAALAVALVVAAGAAFVAVPQGGAAALAGAQQAGEPSYVQKIVLVGRSVRGREIRAYFRGDPAATKVLLVLGQMHGDERAGRDTAVWIVRNIRPVPGTAVWVIPSMNPDGHVRHTRKNARGVDLNRNWPTSGWTRTTRSSRYYGGQRFTFGDKVAVLLGAANRDPVVFANPREMDLRRAKNPHVSFGGGIHYCIGAPLARLELQISLPVLFRRLPNLHLLEEPVFMNSYHFRGLEALKVGW